MRPARRPSGHRRGRIPERRRCRRHPPLRPAAMITLAPAFLAFLFGIIIGSFLNVCISRWPDDLSVVSPRSRCPRCARPITWYENVPILSWLVLRGRCRGCRESISAMYPLIELTVGLLWVLAFLAFPHPF